MLNRVFKTIFILTLCLGITLPANAGSVQVSDGSAFVTKSEMSYQLNSLSNRMAQLENSLDSKIDKLVSSYLTRNGIWNGIKQTTQSYTIKYKNILSIIQTATVTIAGRSDASANPYYNLFSWTVVPKVNKSGLLVMSTQCNHSWDYSMSQTEGAYKHSMWQGIFTGYIEYGKKLTDTTYEILGSTVGAISANAEYFISNNVYYTVAVPKSVFNTQIFVSKDDTIIASIALMYSGRKSKTTTWSGWTVTYSYGCWVDTTVVGSATSATANTDITWNTNGVVY